MKRRHALVALALLVTACARPPEHTPPPPPEATPPANAPNVLLLTVDDMNWDSVGVYGAALPGLTPNIDALAAEGVRFEEAYVTSPICQPSRSAWMTGLYPPASGAVGFVPPKPGTPTLATILRGAGFLVGLMGKNTHTPPLTPESWDAWVTPRALGYARDPQAFGREAENFFLKARAAGRPFFLNVNIQDPHRPFPGGRKAWWVHLVNLGKDDGRPPPPPPSFVTPDKAPVPAYLPDLPEVRRELAQYYTAVHRADESVGRVLEALARAGVADNTLVIFTSDNGQPFPFAKSTNYIAGIRTPMIVRWTGRIPPGLVNRETAPAGIDVAPTILAATTVEAPGPMDGVSFLGAAMGQAAARAPVFTYLDRVDLKLPLLPRTPYALSTRAIRYDDKLYIWNRWADGERTFIADSTSGLTFAAMKRAARNNPSLAARVNFYLKRTPEELYDVRADSAQLRNLATLPAFATDLQDARRRLHAHLQAHLDPLANEYGVTQAQP